MVILWYQEINMSCFKRLIIFIVLAYILNPSGILGQEHKIKPGDVIDILVYGHPEMSRVITVNPDGTLNFPLLQNIPVDGLALNELQDIIIIQLSKYIDQKPFVTVSLVETYTINVVVLGQVVRPGSYQIPVNSTVQGAIGQAGGFLPGANLSAIKIIQKTKKGDNKNNDDRIVDLKQFLITGNPDLLPPLENGDMIVVPSYPISVAVKVIGEVNRPGSYDVGFGNDNLLDIIFMAGGPTDQADLNKILIISPLAQQKQEIQIDLKEKMVSKIYQQIPDIKPGDVIFIPKKKNINVWKIFVILVRDITPIISLYYWIRLSGI